MRTLAPEELACFRDQGYVVLPDVLSPGRLAMLRQAAEEATALRIRYEAEHPEAVAGMQAAEAKGEVIHATEWTHVVMQMYQLWERIPAMRAHSLDPALAELSRTGLGVPALRLWFDQLMIKPPGGGPTPFHQDNTYMPLDPAEAGVITIWAPLTTVSADMGCLCYLPGSHRWPVLPAVPLTSSDAIRPLLTDPDCLAAAVPAEIPEGGVVMHHGNVLHGAGPNSTARPRTAVLTCYYPDGARRFGPLRQYVIDREQVVVGEPLQGPGLPLVVGKPAGR